MNALQEYLDQNGVTRHQVAKQTGIANTTLANAVKETKPLSGIRENRQSHYRGCTGPG